MPPPPLAKSFKLGDKIEVRNDTNGLITWKIATVLRSLSATKMLVQYQTLTQSASSPLEDTVLVEDVRPAPPPELHRFFMVGEQVEAYCTQMNAWRKSTILEILENSVYEVSFQDDTVLQLEHWMLRAVRHWCDGAWFPLFSLQECGSYGKKL